MNAIIDGPFKEAIEEAKSIDKRIKNGQIAVDEFDQKPFLGVPFTAKDNINVEGKLNTLGMLSRQFTKAKEDAESIRLLKQAGAICISTTNVPELCKW